MTDDQQETTPPLSLFSLVQQQLDPDLSVIRCTKATLLHLSHTLENLVLSRSIPALLFIGFQEYNHWRQERERYQKLAQVVQQLYVFVSDSLPLESEVDYIRVTLDLSDPLLQEWFLVILSEPFALVLCGREIQVEATNDATRQFDVIWSFEPDLVNQVLDLLEGVITTYQPEQLAPLRATRASYGIIKPDLTLIADLTMRLVHFEETLHQRFREAEGILQRYQARLEAQVTQRTADLVAANQQLQQEIAERREAEAALAEERNLLRTLIDNLPDFIYVKDTESRFVLANTATLQVLQATEVEQLFGKTDLDLHPPELAAQYYADERGVIQSGKPLIDRQEPFVAPQGEKRWCLTTKVPLRDNQGQIIGLVGVGRDITSRKQEEEELQRYRDHLEDLVIERTAGLREANKQLRQEIAERQRAEAEREHLLAAEHEQRLLAETMQEVTLVLTSQIKLEAILHEILRQAQRLVPYNTANISLLEDDMLRVTYWQGYETFQGEAFVTSLNRRVADLPLAKAAIETRTALVVPDTRQQPGWVTFTETAWIRSHLAVPICLHDQVLGLLRLDGDQPNQFSTEDAQRLQALVNAAAIALENARLYTETQKLFQQTQKQAQQLEQILNSIIAGIILLDSDYRIKVVNSTGQICLPLLAGVEVGQVCTHLGGRPLSEFLNTPPPGGYYEVTPEGQSWPIFEVKIRPVISGPEAEGWVLVVHDVTDQRDIQKRIQEQDKLAAVGQLAAGIAHDFNNILTSIIGFAELARYEPNLPLSVQTDLSHIVQQGKRAAHLVRQILDFARKNITAKRSLEFSGFLKDVVKLLERTIPENIRLYVEVEPEESYVLNADATQLQQVLTNLAVNAADAMPMGGVLKFRLSRLTLWPNQRPPLPELTPGDWLVLDISDTGIGISTQILPHIFEPFFTTKEVGQGTGLGLAQVDGIIKQHEGFTNVESQVGVGTTFTLYLPLFYSKQSAPSEIIPPTKFPGQGEILLLVEDDVAVLEVTQAMLKSLGYQVLTAANGLTALEVYERYQNEIALVVTDLTMPDMGGLALAEALRSKNRGVKVLAMTGYPLKIGTGALRASGIVGWLQKPLSLEQLAQKLEFALKN
jgi:PAS domain S-box-containing protein